MGSGILGNPPCNPPAVDGFDALLKLQTLASHLSRNSEISVLRDMLNTPLALGEIQNLLAACACLSDRFVGSAERSAEQLTLSICGEEPPRPIDFTDIANDQSLSREARGEAILKRIAERIVPPLLLTCVDLTIAHAAALEIATQLGDAALATLEQAAVQRATAQRMVGRPLSTTHIELESDGKVRVHRTSQWTAYENAQGQEVESGIAHTPVLEVGLDLAFWLEPDPHNVPPTHALATKTFALHGNVQHCFLQTPDAELKAMLTRSPSRFDEDVMHGLARLFEAAQIQPEPSTRREPRTPSRILDGAQRRIEPSAAHAPAHPRTMGIATLPDASGVRVLKPQGTPNSPALVFNQLFAALEFGQYCSTTVSRLIVKSYTKSKAKKEAPEKCEAYKEEIQAIRNKFNNDIPLTTEGFLSYVSMSLESSAGNCLEMAMVAATMAQSNARAFLLARGVKSVEVHAEIYDTQPSAPYGDHMLCVINVTLDAQHHKIAVDPWMGISMPYDDYVKYARAHPVSPHIETNTEFGFNESISNVLKHPDFVERARQVINPYWD